MAKTSQDLFRSGNATSARLDYIRPKDVAIHLVNGVEWVRANTGGISTYANPDPTFTGKWWRLPAGSVFDDRLLLLWNDLGDHWMWEPTNDMPLTDYKAALATVNAQFIPV